MQGKKELKAQSFVYRNGKKINFEELSEIEKNQFAVKWNRIAMENAGYIPERKSIKKKELNKAEDK